MESPPPAAPWAERLAQMDNAFLVYEDEVPAGTMHVAATQIHDARPLQGPGGELDIERIEEYVHSRLDRIPRYRQRLARTPVEGHPVWVDDDRFHLRYHLRHARLPRPGSERQLKRMVGRIVGQRLDRDKPLWELWVIEGLEGERLAITSKVHHCMVDGISGSEIIAALLTPEPREKPEAPSTWRPRPTPGRLALGVSEATRWLAAPLEAARGVGRLVQDRDGSRHRLVRRLRALGSLAGELGPAAPVPFNRPVGPHRRVDWLEMPLDRVRAVRRATGGTVNDVVLATAAGALARYLSRDRGVDLDGLRFKVMTPVSLRTPGDPGRPGNRVSGWTLRLPLEEADPLARLSSLRRQTDRLKRSQQALGADLLTQATEWTGTALLSLSAQLVAHSTPFNLVVTNVPGPRVPLYLLQSRLLAVHPHVPLTGTLGLGIALFSYADTLSWGFNADWDLVPDLHRVVSATRRSFDELCRAAGLPDT